ATAYSRIADLQGYPMGSNLGDASAASASYQKCIALREALAGSNPRNRTDQVDLAVAYVDYGDFQNQAAGNPLLGFEYVQKGRAILDREAAAAPNDFRIILESSNAYISLGILQVGNGLTGTVGTVSGAITALQKALVLDQRAIQLSPTDMRARRQEALISALLGDAEVKLGDRLEALNHYRRSQNIYNSLNTKGDDIRVVLNSVVLTGKIADVLLTEGKTSEAITWFWKTELGAKQLAANDPHSEAIQRLVITSSAQLGHSLVEGGSIEEGLTHLHKALAVAESLPGQIPLVRIFEAQIHLWTGEAAERKGKLREAVHEYAKGKEILRALRATGINDLRTQVHFSSATDCLAAA